MGGISIYYVTTNKAKFDEAISVIPSLIQKPLDITEIQGTPQQILLAKAKQASQHLQEPFLIEDVSLFCPALQGLPGPYIKTFLRNLGHTGLADLIHRYPDHSAEALCAVAYCSGPAEPVIFEGRLQGKIVKARGQHKMEFSFNPIFQTSGKTLAEDPTYSMRKLALQKFLNFFHQHN